MITKLVTTKQTWEESLLKQQGTPVTPFKHLKEYESMPTKFNPPKSFTIDIKEWSKEVLNNLNKEI